MEYLDQPTFTFKPVTDTRRHMDEPLPVSLEAVADMHLPTARLAREKLNRLYIDILEFAAIDDSDHIAFQADNFALRFDLPRRELSQQDFRPVRILVPSLAATEAKLVEAEIDYERQKGILPGHEILALTDPDGNYLEIREHREIG